MNTQTQTQTKYTVEQVVTMLLEMKGRVDNIEAQLSKKSLKKTVKPKRSAEEIEAENMRKEADKQAKAEAKAKKAAEKLAAKEAKAEAKAKKAAEKLKEKQERDAKKAAEKLKEKQERDAKKAADKAAKEAKKLAKGPSLDKTYTKKRFNLYRDLKPNDPENQFKGLGTKGAFLRIAKKKDGSDTTVYRVNPDNWPEEAIKHFDSLEDKWNRKGLPFSPDYVAPEPKIKSAKKKAPKKKKAAKKTLVEQTAVVDTDDELEEQPPAEYSLYRQFRMGEKSGETTWKQFSSSMMITAKQEGLVAVDNWAYKRFAGDKPFNDKCYDTNPLKPKVGKNIIKNGVVVGNCAETFNPLTEDGKDADTVGVEDEMEDDDDDIDLIPDTFNIDEYDSDGFMDLPYDHHPEFAGLTLRRTKTGRVFTFEDGVQNKYLGIYNVDTDEIENNSSSEEESQEDGFGSENDMVDTTVF